MSWQAPFWLWIALAAPAVLVAILRNTRLWFLPGCATVVAGAVLAAAAHGHYGFAALGDAIITLFAIGMLYYGMLVVAVAWWLHERGALATSASSLVRSDDE